MTPRHVVLVLVGCCCFHRPLTSAEEEASNSTSRMNHWTRVVDSGVGPRVSPALVWSKDVKRFVMIGGTISHQHEPPFPYDILSLNEEEGQWENALPPGGEKWGPRVGPVEPPPFESPWFEFRDEAGNARPWRRHARMWYHGRIAPWDGAVYTLMCGRTLRYNVDRRTWANLEPPTAPAPTTRSEKRGLNWSAMCPDPLNQEIVLFGGCGLDSPRGDPGTWVYSPKQNSWRRLDLDVQPPQRALSPMVYDPATRKIVLFGGDGLDTLHADTWVYDCATRTWEQRSPDISPSPRFGHALLRLPECGKIVLLGGVGYTSSTSYQALLYKPLPFEIWTYDVAENRWSLVKRYGEDDVAPTHFATHAAVAAADAQDRVLWWGPKTNGARHRRESATWLCHVDGNVADHQGTAQHGVKPGTVAHRTGPYDPDWYAQDVPLADVEQQQKFYDALPENRWTPVEAPKWPENRQGGGWSTVAYDSDRQQLLHLGGGHSSYFGNDVAHFDTRAARWSISYRPQFALDFNYDLTGPGPTAFNGGPWGNHNYHAYTYDPPRRRLIYIRNEYTHIYDPERRAWPYEERIDDNPFYGSKYTSYATATPGGAVVWALRQGSQTQSGVWKLAADGWRELETTGDALPRPVTDGSTITFDAPRHRLLLTTTRGERDVEHSGQVWACDLESGRVTRLDPVGREKIVVKRFARESVFLPKQDLVLLGYHLDRTNRLPLYDVAANSWRTAEVPGSEFFARGDASGTSVDLGLRYDAARELVWAVMCKLHPGAVQVMRVSDALQLNPL